MAGGNSPGCAATGFCSPLHLSPKLPQPLILPATVTGVVLRDNGASLVRADFADLSKEMEEWLERTLSASTAAASSKTFLASTAKAEIPAPMSARFRIKQTPTPADAFAAPKICKICTALPPRSALPPYS